MAQVRQADQRSATTSCGDQRRKPPRWPRRLNHGFHTGWAFAGCGGCIGPHVHRDGRREESPDLGPGRVLQQNLNGCNGGQITTPWTYIRWRGAVSGGQYNNTGPFGKWDSARTGALLIATTTAPREMILTPTRAPRAASPTSRRRARRSATTRPRVPTPTLRATSTSSKFHGTTSETGFWGRKDSKDDHGGRPCRDGLHRVFGF